MSFSSKQFIPLLKASLLLIVMGFSFLYGQITYTTLTPDADKDLTIPPNLTKMTIKVWGAGGGGGQTSTGGAGGYTQATVSVTPGDVYRIVVGEPGGYENHREEEGSRPGFLYPHGDSVWVDELWFYGSGGCADTDDIGCGSMSSANLWPQVNRPSDSHVTDWYTGGPTLRWPLAPDGSQWPAGWALKTPADPMWSVWNDMSDWGLSLIHI